MKRKLKILVSAGEASGDLHGAVLIRHIKEIAGEAEIFGIGGDKMSEAGAEILCHFSNLAVVGFTEVTRKIKNLWNAQSALKREILRRKPAGVVLIDFPGFNLPLAKFAKMHGVRTFYYIAPQLWAWGKGRLKKLKKYIDVMLVVLPFERELYQKAGMKVHFVGHPLLDVMGHGGSREEFLKEMGFSSEFPIIGLLPGSREHEIKRIYPVMVKTVEILSEKFGAIQVATGMAPSIPPPLYKKYTDVSVKILPDTTYEIMKHSDLVLVASGTATLETACFGTPMLIIYKISPVSWWLGKMMVKLKHIGLVNIIAGVEIVPELLQGDAVPEKIARKMLRLLTNRDRLDEMREKLSGVKAAMGQKGASRRAAEIVLENLKG
ncbi:MAG: lipid-A-disaccharide synthase [Fidelibacterota bacterium]